MKNSKPAVLIALVILSLGGLIYWATRPKVDAPPSWEELRRYGLAEDRAALANPEASEAAIVGALQRLAPLKDPLVLAGLKTWSSSTSLRIREQSATALAFVPDDVAIPLLDQLIFDSEQAVRVAAIRSLGQTSSPSRQKKLEELWKSKDNLSEEESVALGLTLFEKASGKAREPYEAFLYTRIEKGREAGPRISIAIKLLSIEPQNEKLLSTLRRFVDERAQDAPLAGQSLRLLVPLGDKATTAPETLARFSKDASPIFRAYLAQSLAGTCVPQSESIFVNLLTDKDPFVRASSERALLEMSRERAESILENIGAKQNPNLSKLEAELSRLDRSGPTCAP
jgi:HEAT repeat protein